jgi:hypothetical protein
MLDNDVVESVRHHTLESERCIGSVFGLGLLWFIDDNNWSKDSGSRVSERVELVRCMKVFNGSVDVAL